MRVTRLQMLVGGVLLALAGTSYAQTATALQLDPAWQEGKLDNGFSWQLLQTPQRPSDRTELRLMVDTGSLVEGAQQKGFSTLLPQIALRYSKHFTADELRNFWQQVDSPATAAPPVVNSYGFTLYKVSLPNNRPELLKSALTWLADSVGSLPITELTVNAVRQDLPPFATFPLNLDDPWWRYSLQGSNMLGHDPKLVEGEVSVEALQSFYKQYYTPDVMTLYVVGNVESRHLSEQINELFSDLQGKRETPAPIATLAPLPSKPVYLIGETDSANSLSLVWDQSWVPIRTIATLHKYWVSDLAREAVLDRLQKALLAEKNKTVVKLDENCLVQFQRLQCALYISPGQNGVKAALEQVAQLIAKLDKEGVSQAEFEALIESKQKKLNMLFLNYARMGTQMLMDQHLQLQTKSIVNISPENYQRLRQTFLASLTRDVINQELRSQLALAPILVFKQAKGQQNIDINELDRLYHSLVKPQLQQIPVVEPLPDEQQRKPLPDALQNAEEDQAPLPIIKDDPQQIPAVEESPDKRLPDTLQSVDEESELQPATMEEQQTPTVEPLQGNLEKGPLPANHGWAAIVEGTSPGEQAGPGNT